MTSDPKRYLIKGPLKAPPFNPSNLSQTQTTASRDEFSVRSSKEKEITVVEFSSRAVPQPFLDPTIIPRRIQAEKEWKAEQEKKLKQGAASQGA